MRQKASIAWKSSKNWEKEGINSELYPDAVKLKKQMNYANAKGIRYVIMIGEDEVKSGLISVKDMQSGEQQKLTVDNFISSLTDSH